MPDALGRRAGWRVRRAAPVVAMLAATGLVAGCQISPAGSAPAGPAPGVGDTGTTGTSGNGGTGGRGGDGYGGRCGNGYGGDGGDANGVDGATGHDAAAGSGRLTSRTIDLSGVTSVVTDATLCGAPEDRWSRPGRGPDGRQPDRRLVEDLRLRAAGGSQLPLAESGVRRLDAELSGASHALVMVSDTLAVRASGASVMH